MHLLGFGNAVVFTYAFDSLMSDWRINRLSINIQTCEPYTFESESEEELPKYDIGTSQTKVSSGKKAKDNDVIVIDETPAPESSTVSWNESSQYR